MTDYKDVKKWRSQNPDKVAAQARRYRAKHPDKIKVVKNRYREKTRDERLPREAAQARARRAADPEGQRRRYARWREKKERDREALAGRPKPDTCEICGELNIRIVFDHCHRRGHFRGWICDRCNRVLGLVKDSTELLMLLARYINGEIDSSNTQSDSVE